MLISRGLVTALMCAAPALCALYENVSDLPTLTYDFIVIGGGTAGNVIANRLTEDPSISVLVLEAGGLNDIIQDTPPLLSGPTAPFDWNYTTTPQAGLNGRAIAYARGFVLGGSSSVNFMTYTRGSADDFDRLATLVGDESFSWKNLLPYMFKSERLVAPNDHHNTTGEFDPTAHSTSGALPVSLAGYPWPEDSRVVAVTRDPEAGKEFLYNEDMNSGDMIGIGWAPASVGHGRRSSSASEYLTPSVLARPNLDVLLHARVTRMIQTTTSGDLPVFQQIEFSMGTTDEAPRIIATARLELILCAGTFNTPQLLMLSGVGDPAHLASFNITSLVPNRAVGANMSDHALLAQAWHTRASETVETYTRDADLLAVQEALWRRTGTGPLSFPTDDLIGWLRLPENSSILKATPDPSAGAKSAHYELLFRNGFAVFGQTTPPNGSFFSILTNVVTPTSRGTVSLSSPSPFAPPSIDPNFLGADFDIQTMVAAIRSAQRFVASAPFKDFIVRPFGDFARVYDGTDDDLAAYARANTLTVHHVVGTAAMGAVVDTRFRLKGARAVRIVDASVIPRIPSAHTQAMVYILAERAADLIKADWHV